VIIAIIAVMMVMTVLCCTEIASWKLENSQHGNSGSVQSSGNWILKTGKWIHDI
jgi:hypothetical protein